jgi:hypothetical protein
MAIVWTAYLCKLANWIPLGKIPTYANDLWTSCGKAELWLLESQIVHCCCALRLNKCAAGNKSIIISIPSADLESQAVYIRTPEMNLGARAHLFIAGNFRVNIFASLS